MKRTYTLFQQYIASTLLISICLQSCGGGFDNNSLISTCEKQLAYIATHAQEITVQTSTHPLVDQVLTVQGGHAVTFYKEAGELRANVVMSAPQGFSKDYEGLAVYIEQGTELSDLPRLGQQAQQRRIHLQLAQGEKPAHIVIYKGAGLMGGGNTGKNKGKEKLKEGDEEYTKHKSYKSQTKQHKRKLEEEEYVEGDKTKGKQKIIENKRRRLTQQKDKVSTTTRAISNEKDKNSKAGGGNSRIKSTRKTNKTKLYSLLPPEIWAMILSYLPSNKIMYTRQINRDFYSLVTGYDCPGVHGIKNKPPENITRTNLWSINKEIDFKIGKVSGLTTETIPSFFFYRLVRRVEGLPRVFWPHLKETNIHTVGLTGNSIGICKQSSSRISLNEIQQFIKQTSVSHEMLIEFITHLKGTKVHTLNLSNNKLEHIGIEDFAKALQETQVHTIDLSSNNIGTVGATKFVKNLQNTQVHTVNLSNNRLEHTEIEILAKALQGTNVHTIDLSRNQIRNGGAIEFVKNLQNTQVHTVNLSNNSLGHIGIEDFAKALQETQVHTIDLSSNHIGTVDAIKFVKNLQNTQVHTVNLSNNKLVGIEGLAKALQRTNVHTIDLSRNQIDAVGAIQLVQDLKGTNVHALDLFGNRIHAQDIVRLLNLNYTLKKFESTENRIKELLSTQNDGELNLDGKLNFSGIRSGMGITHQVDEQGSIILINHPIFKQKILSCQKINLSNNLIGNIGAIELAKALEDTGVQTIDLSNANLTYKGVVAFIKHLKGTKVHTLNLRNIKNLTKQRGYVVVGDEDEDEKESNEFAEALQGTQIQTVDLSNANLSYKGAVEFVKHLKGTKVHTLNLSENNIEDFGAGLIGYYLKNTSIHTLDLSGNNIGAAGAIQIALNLKLKEIVGVRTLNLSWNNIEHEGAEGFAKHLKGTEVHTLDLSNNHIGDRGAKGFAKYLKGTKVGMLNLSNNNIGDAGASNLVEHLIGTKVHTINLSGNKISSKGLINFIQGLQETKVHTVSLGGDFYMTPENQVEVAKALQRTKIHTVDLSIPKSPRLIGFSIDYSKFFIHLKGTKVHTVNLSNNKIGNEKAREIAKSLQGTKIHTIYFKNVGIGAATRQFLEESYPKITWIF
ncbi:MAG: hypothetical protein ACYC2U_01070 [Candidatus Amoebophilus sp.]